MRDIKRVTVDYTDGTGETWVGRGTITEVKTTKTVEEWDRNKPDAKHPSERIEGVEYVIATLVPEATL